MTDAKKKLEERVNKLAIKMAQEDSASERYVAWRLQLIDDCLCLVMNSDINNLAANLSNNSDKFNAEVFMNTINYTLNSYNSENGDFINLFRYTYKLRSKSAESAEIMQQKLPGITKNFTAAEMGIIREVQKYSHLRFSSLMQAAESNSEGKANLAKICDDLQLNQQALAELYNRYKAQVVFIDNIKKEYEETVQIAAGVDEQSKFIDKTAAISKINKLFTKILAEATNKQQIYYRLFIANQLMDVYDLAIPTELSKFIELDFFEYCQGQVLKDNELAQYLHTDKSNISKYRKKYVMAMKMANKEITMEFVN